MRGRGMRGDWVDLAAFLMMLAGAIDGLQGLIAIVRNKYYSFTPNQILVVDLTTWGWILLVWGVVVALAGAGLWLRSEAARWFAVVLLLLNLIGELTFAGAHGSTLWAVTANLLTVIVLYALIVRWEGAADAGVTS
jgi:uncharacterized membrane protein (DUF2068 family)